jgi:hypothetical protein
MSESTIFLNGYARGGTNIVWNLLQSHPGINKWPASDLHI